MRNQLQASAPAIQECDVTHQAVFSCLQASDLELFDKHKSCLFFKKGQQIFREGSFPLGVYCINQGKVKLEHSGDEGKMQIVRMAKSGDLIGYRALFCDERYNATAVALEDTQILFVPKDALFRVMQENSCLSMQIIRLLAKGLRQAEDNLTEFAQKSVRERMANALLFLHETYGVDNIKGAINVALTRQELADLIGTATETAIRLLSELKNDGLVEFIGRRIRILNIAALKQVAHNYQGYQLY